MTQPANQDSGATGAAVATGQAAVTVASTGVNLLQTVGDGVINALRQLVGAEGDLNTHLNNAAQADVDQFQQELHDLISRGKNILGLQ